MRDIGKNIKAVRQANGITQEALAEALYVTRQTVSNYENGRSRPDLDTLIKIAEILNTDVNTIIYGPPIPQSKKDSYKWLAISLGILAVTGILYFITNEVLTNMYQEYYARILNRHIFIPASMFVLGWVLLHCLGLFTGLEQLKKERIKAVRIVLLVIGCILVVVPIPMLIFHGVALYRSVVYASVSMRFPHIPVYWEIYSGMFYLSVHAPFVYSILGGIFWLFGLPRIRRVVNNESKVEE